ncbi:MAG: hypothetical protein ACK5RO_10100 [Pseudobdellovibrionaceae bacterium]|jgi:hypothetical protein
MRLLAIIIGSFVVFGMGLLTVRFWGLSQVYSPYQTPFFSEPESELLIAPWEQAFFSEKFPKLILWVDVYRGDDKALIVRPWKDRALLLNDLEKSVSPARPLLTELLKTHAQQRFILNMIANEQGIHHQIKMILDETKAKDRVVISSEYPIVMESIKELEPTALFGSSSADIVRFKSFLSLGILPASPFKGDLLITQLTKNKIELINPEIAQEIKRRQKKLILGPLENHEDILKARALIADGLFVSDPLLLNEQK